MDIRIYIWVALPSSSKRVENTHINMHAYISVDVDTDLNSLPSLRTLSKPHSPRTHAVAPHELRCDSPAHSENKAALSLHGVHSPLVPHLSHTPRCR